MASPSLLLWHFEHSQALDQSFQCLSMEIKDNLLIHSENLIAKGTNKGLRHFICRVLLSDFECSFPEAKFYVQRFEKELGNRNINRWDDNLISCNRQSYPLSLTGRGSHFTRTKLLGSVMSMFNDTICDENRYKDNKVITYFVVNGYCLLTNMCAPSGKSDGWTISRFVNARLAWGHSTTANLEDQEYYERISSNTKIYSSIPSTCCHRCRLSTRHWCLTLLVISIWWRCRWGWWGWRTTWSWVFGQSRIITSWWLGISSTKIWRHWGCGSSWRRGRSRRYQLLLCVTGHSGYGAQSQTPPTSCTID